MLNNGVQESSITFHLDLIRVDLVCMNKDFLYTIIHHCLSLFSTVTITTTLVDLEGILSKAI